MADSTVFDLSSLWDESLSSLTATITSPAQRRWLSATRPVGFSHDTVVLAAPHTFAREWLDVRCGDHLREALSRAAGRSLQVVITVKPNPAPLEPDLAEEAHPAPERRDTAPVTSTRRDPEPLATMERPSSQAAPRGSTRTLRTAPARDAHDDPLIQSSFHPTPPSDPANHHDDVPTPRAVDNGSVTSPLQPTNLRPLE
ncbi:MAG: hypothetical protein M3252_00225, partial [Actinomycetota bacterium]|nr:hypothetical protein [Actinomycetota bacterium]